MWYWVQSLKTGLQLAIDTLSQNSSRVSTSVAYMNHLHARLDTLDIMKRLVTAKAPSRWKFECYLLVNNLPSISWARIFFLVALDLPLSSGAMEALVQRHEVMHQHPTKDCADYFPSTYQSYSPVSFAPHNGVHVVMHLWRTVRVLSGWLSSSVRLVRPFFLEMCLRLVSFLISLSSSDKTELKICRSLLWVHNLKI